MHLHADPKQNAWKYMLLRKARSAPLQFKKLSKTGQIVEDISEEQVEIKFLECSKWRINGAATHACCLSMSLDTWPLRVSQSLFPRLLTASSLRNLEQKQQKKEHGYIVSCNLSPPLIYARCGWCRLPVRTAFFTRNESRTVKRRWCT